METNCEFCTLIKNSELSASELAQKISKTRACISQYKTGKRKPGLETMYKLAEVLAIPVSDIMACFYTKPKEIEV